MLKVVLFVFYFGSACAYQRYDATSFDEFDYGLPEDVTLYGYTDKSHMNAEIERKNRDCCCGNLFSSKESVFPDLTLERKDWVFNFKVRRDSHFCTYFELYFWVQCGIDDVHFSSNSEKYQLDYFMITFYGEENRLYLRFSSLSRRKELTVISRVFLPPRSLSEWTDVEDNAVTASFVTPDVMDSLHKDNFRDYNLYRKATINVDWILDILQKAQPRFEGKIKSGSLEREIYRSVPLVIHDLEKLGEMNKVLI